jgi:hypothetical protein
MSRISPQGRLTLHRTTLRRLSASDLSVVAGGLNDAPGTNESEGNCVSHEEGDPKCQVPFTHGPTCPKPNP